MKKKYNNIPLPNQWMNELLKHSNQLFGLIFFFFFNDPSDTKRRIERNKSLEKSRSLSSLSLIIISSTLLTLCAFRFLLWFDWFSCLLYPFNSYESKSFPIVCSLFILCFLYLAYYSISLSSLSLFFENLMNSLRIPLLLLLFRFLLYKFDS